MGYQKDLSAVLTYPQMITVHDVVWTGITGCTTSDPTPGLGSTLTGNAGWNNSYAASQRTITGDGWISFQVTATNTDYGVIGLTLIAPPYSNSNNVLDYAFYPYGGDPYIEELNQQPHHGGSYNTSSVFKIARVGTQITYSINGSVYWTSTKPSTGTLMFAASFNSGPGIIDALIYNGQ